MSMTRAQLVAALWGTLQRQFIPAEFDSTDTTGNLKEPVDATLLALGVAYAGLATGEVATGSEAKAMILARYYGLSAIYDAVLMRVDLAISVGAPSVSKTENKSQYIRQLENALFRARDNAEPFLPSTGANSWVVTSIDLGIVDPVCEVPW